MWRKRHIDLHSLLHLVEHTSYHLGQVVDRTKSIKGQQFNFCQNGINEKNLKIRVETSFRKRVILKRMTLFIKEIYGNIHFYVIWLIT